MHSNIATFFQQAGFIYRAISKSAQLIGNSGTLPHASKFSVLPLSTTSLGKIPCRYYRQDCGKYHE